LAYHYKGKSLQMLLVGFKTGLLLDWQGTTGPYSTAGGIFLLRALTPGCNM